MNYLLEKKQQEKVEKRKLRLMQQSNVSLQAAPRTIEEAIEEVRSKLSSSHHPAGGQSVDEESSSSSEDLMNEEGLLAVKDIEKLTGGNMDIKPLTIDISSMRKLVHTPKEGIRVPLDTDKVIAKLENWAKKSPISPWALVDEPKNRKTSAVFQAYETKRANEIKAQSPPKETSPRRDSEQQKGSLLKRKTLNLAQKSASIQV